MSDSIEIRRALISVYDKTGIVDFARALHEEFGIEIISTGGTAKTLREAGIPVTLVEDITGFPEMMDGRVKTLHPKIHAAILADRDNPEHMRQLKEQGIEPIDMVVVNLYPFEQTIAKPDCTFEEAIEMIDIGGPCLLRAAAKNCRHVLVCPEPALYDAILLHLRDWPADQKNAVHAAQLEGAFEAFRRVSTYNEAIAQWLSGLADEDRVYTVVRGRSWGPLRYGENPHQRGEALHDTELRGEFSLTTCDAYFEDNEELSFNNYADASAALELCAELTRAGSRMHRLLACATQQSARATQEKGGRAEPGDATQQKEDHMKVWHRLIAGAKPAPAGSKKKSPFKAIDDETCSRRNLPHIQRPGATYFVTFRVREGSLTAEERDPVMECCLFPDGKTLCLHEAVVMPDHVHLLFTPLESSPGEVHPLSKIMHSIKGNAGRKVADHRGRGGGPIWQDESFDHILRNESDFWETLEYIYTNPARAELEAEGAYPWRVYEDEPAWDPSTRGAVPNSEHILRAEGREARPWHRLLAGATQPTGATQPAEGTQPAEDTQATAASRYTCPTTTRKAVCFIKHTNACGAATATAADESPQAVAAARLEAYRKAYLGDPNAAMGGILAVNFNVDAPFAEAVMETYQHWGKTAGAGGFFVEVWLAPSFDDNAVKIIRTRKKWGQRVRLLDVGDLSIEPDPSEMDFKRIAGGVLMQNRDLVGLNEDQWKVATKRQPSKGEMDDLRLAWLICKHTKSNAITICRDGMLIGNGAGQMSRVMSCRIATWLAKENGHEEKLKGAAAASDAFFPFRDGPDLLIDAGVTAIIQPGGSKRDEEVIAACDERGVAMIMTGTRHFRH